MSYRRQPVRKAFGRELGKVVNQRYRPELGNDISTLYLRDQGNNSIVQARDVDSTKTKTLNNITHQLFQLGPKFPKERDGEAIRPRGCVRVGSSDRIEDLLFRRGINNPSFSSREICSRGDQKVDANLKPTSGLAYKRVEKK